MYNPRQPTRIPGGGSGRQQSGPCGRWRWPNAPAGADRQGRSRSIGRVSPEMRPGPFTLTGPQPPERTPVTRKDASRRPDGCLRRANTSHILITHSDDGDDPGRSPATPMDHRCRLDHTDGPSVWVDHGATGGGGARIEAGGARGGDGVKRVGLGRRAVRRRGARSGRAVRGRAVRGLGGQGPRAVRGRGVRGRGVRGRGVRGRGVRGRGVRGRGGQGPRAVRGLGRRGRRRLGRRRRAGRSCLIRRR